jgi:hypothetical protein
LDTKLKTLLCIEITVTESKEVKTGRNLTESSKERYGSEWLFSQDDDELERMCKEAVVTQI